MSKATSQHRTLGVYPHLTGFAYAVVERGVRLVDWGQIKLGVNTDRECRTRVEELINGLNRPTLIVLEDCTNTRRGKRARRRIDIAAGVAAKAKIHTGFVTGTEMRSVLELSSGATKNHIAAEIVRRFPELKRRMPRNTSWQRDPRMFVFEAVALALAAP